MSYYYRNITQKNYATLPTDRENLYIKPRERHPVMLRKRSKVDTTDVQRENITMRIYENINHLGRGKNPAVLVDYRNGIPLTTVQQTFQPQNTTKLAIEDIEAFRIPGFQIDYIRPINKLPRKTTSIDLNRGVPYEVDVLGKADKRTLSKAINSQYLPQLAEISKTLAVHHSINPNKSSKAISDKLNTSMNVQKVMAMGQIERLQANLRSKYPSIGAEAGRQTMINDNSEIPVQELYSKLPQYESRTNPYQNIQYIEEQKHDLRSKFPQIDARATALQNIYKLEEINYNLNSKLPKTDTTLLKTTTVQSTDQVGNLNMNRNIHRAQYTDQRINKTDVYGRTDGIEDLRNAITLTRKHSIGSIDPSSNSHAIRRL